MCIRDSPGSPREAPPARPPSHFVGRFGICAKSDAEPAPPELQGPTLRSLGPTLRSFLGPRSSRFERRKRF
eukprot:1391472-Alexandrium_andersonii.AAC.1